MAMIFADNSFNLDSLSDVKGFSSAYNGITYGLKKIGGTFVPASVQEGQAVTGIIPNSGLYEDATQRVGVYLKPDSGLNASADGLKVVTGDGLTINNGQVKVVTGGGLTLDNGKVIVNPEQPLKITNDLLTIGLQPNDLDVDSSGNLGVNTNFGSGLYASSPLGLHVDVDNDTIEIGGNGNKVVANPRSLQFGNIIKLETNENIKIPRANAFEEIYKYELPPYSVAYHFTRFKFSVEINTGGYYPKDSEIIGDWSAGGIYVVTEPFGYVAFTYDGSHDYYKSNIYNYRSSTSMLINDGPTTITPTLRVSWDSASGDIDDNDTFSGTNWTTYIRIVPLPE